MNNSPQGSDDFSNQKPQEPIDQTAMLKQLIESLKPKQQPQPAP